MSSSDTLNELYQKHAPRWFKVIRWREWGDRFVKGIKYKIIYIGVPCFLAFSSTDNLMVNYIWLYGAPKNEEEMELYRRNTQRDVFQRNWDLGMYKTNVPPKYDLWERRQKYPQYYAGRYDGFRRDGDKVLPKSTEEP